VRRILATLTPAAALALCLYAVQLPLFVIGPGPAREVLPLIDIEGAPTFQPDGRLLLTTISTGRLNAYHAVRAWIDPEAQVVTERTLVPRGQTDRQYEQVSLSQMDGSKVAAVAVALERVTNYPREHGRGVIIQATLPGTPAEGALFPGDLVTSIDGRRLGSVGELTAAIRIAGTQRVLRLTVRPLEGGASRTVRIRPARHPGEPQPIIGVSVVNNFPFEVRIESGDIGGPSAGLMWALGVTDLLTPGDLTGGRTVAGTGDVGLDGSVAPIGGVAFKVAAAEDAGAGVFLVPRGNMSEARGVADAIELVPVATVQDALRYLEGRPS
jgi:PDZ domain-containing protein